MKKRIVSMILLTAMVFSTIGSAVAADWDTEFAELQKYLGVKQSPLETTEQVRDFREKYWHHLFPEQSKPQKYATFNNQSVLDYDIFYYGWPDVVEGNRKDMSGKWLYLGYTRDNRKISNITFNAKPWKSPQLIDRDYYVDGPGKDKFTGLIPPFKTEYNNPKYVGKAYLGQDITDIEAEAYGRRVIEAWAKNVMNRDIGWQDGKQFYAIFNNNLDAFLKYVTITVPPTSRSYGQCLAWFRSNNGLTHRTFYIAPTEDIDFIAKRYEWDEPTKTLTVFYEVKGLEKIEGKFSTSLFFKAPDLEKYVNYSDGFYKDGPSVIIASELNEDTNKLKMIMWWNEELQRLGHMYLENYVKKDLRVPEYKLTLQLPHLKDNRTEDLVGDIFINSTGDFPEYKANAYLNNQMPVIIPATNKVIASDL
ncbi:MAG TPA: hypothetical protein GX519_02250, partial [Thermoanaerobacterales bacterium]|nr:hypothetical protein [Thermoanaerobacterales bacterium]